MKPSHMLRTGTLALALGCGFAGSLALLTPPTSLHAQSLISGDIAGSVVDASGAAIPGASVTITNNETGAVTTATTSASGQYHGSLLKPGNYTVLVSAPNFQSAQITASVGVGQTATANVTLSVGSGSQTVRVEASAISLLQPENSDLGTTIDLQQVQNLPNPGGDITYYINLTQGVVMNTQGGYGNSSAFGLPATSNNFTVNGAEDNDPFLNLNNSGPSNLLLGANDVGEINIVANAYSAQYGSLGGVQENIITRSGSNGFHGNATYWWTNSDMNANDWFNDNSGSTQPFSNANQWGIAGGGPIIRDKTFFFANYEGLRFITAPADRVYIPTASYESNVLSNLAASNPGEVPFYQSIFNLYNNAPGASLATPVGGETLTAPPNSSAAVIAAYAAESNYSRVFEANPKNSLSEVLVTARIDHKIGPNDNAFAHFKYDHGVQPTYVDPINTNFNAQSDQPDWEGQLEETHTFSPNLVNQFLFATSWYSAYFLSDNQSVATATFPYELSFGDGSFNNIGGADLAWPEGRNVTQYQFSEDLSWTKGKHTASFGGIFKRADTTDADLGVLTTPLGVELGPGEAQATGNLGYDFFLGGAVYEGVQNFPTRLTEPIALYNLGVYAQDQWKVLPNFQITAGVRVEHNSNPICVTNCFAHFNDSYYNVTDTLDTPYNSMVKSGLHTAFTSLQKYAVDPRVGFTFSPPGNDKIVVRGGFGMFSDIFPATTADSLLDNAPLNPEFAVVGANTSPSDPNSFTGALSSVNQTFVSQFANGGTYNTIAAANPNFTTSLPSVFNPDKSIHYPTYEEYSFQIQQQIGKYTSYSVGYVGNHGYHTPVLNNGVNIAETTTAPGTFTGLPATQALPSFGSVTEVQSVGTSNYNGLLVTVKHESKPLTVLFNYAYSHALDEVSNGGFLNFGGNGTHPVDPFNLALQNYGNADYDIRHNMNGSYIFRIPHFGGPKTLADGWQITGTAFYHTGFPFSVVDSVGAQNINGAGTYGGAVLADIINPAVPHHCGKNITNPCFGAGTVTPGDAYFADPTSFGGQRRNQFFGPGYFNTDIGLSKSFAVPKVESGHLQIGAQAYNVLNHPDFANPAYDFDSPGTFGLTQNTVSVPTSVYGSFLGGDASARIIQLKAKFEF